MAKQAKNLWCQFTPLCDDKKCHKATTAGREFCPDHGAIVWPSDPEELPVQGFESAGQILLRMPMFKNMLGGN